MKKVIITTIILCFSLILNGQVSKTINVTAGNLKTLLSQAELSTVTNLTITGTIDARDFRTMSYEMPVLQIVDLSGTTVTAYSGTEGTDNGFWDYPADAVPAYAFSRGLSGNENLKSIKLPSKVTSVGYGAFYNCTALSSIILPSTITVLDKVAFGSCTSLAEIDLPSSLRFIGEGAFMGCCALTSVLIPESVTTILRVAFLGCTSLTSINIPSSVTSLSDNIFSGEINIDEGNPVYSSIDGIVFNKSKTSLIHYPANRNGGYTIPSTVTTIEMNAFLYCAGLTSVTIPSSVSFIGYYSFGFCSSLTSLFLPSSVSFIDSFAFSNCSSLSSIYTYRQTPSETGIYQGVFEGVDKSACTLYVPFGSSPFYTSTNQWQDFLNIIEMSEFKLSATSISYPATGGSIDVSLTTGLAWTAVSDKPWLKLSQTSGTGSSTLTLTLEANPYIISRLATITVSVPGIPSQSILLTQAMSPGKVIVSAGSLLTALTPEELSETKKLVLSGTIDARDFKTMRDNMPFLSDLDLSGVEIKEYSGTQGTYGTNNIIYSANHVPFCAFLNPYNLKGKTTLKSVVLPGSVSVCHNYSFYGCTGLTSINIPQNVIAIGHSAFLGCLSLVSVEIPSSVEIIGKYAFVSCSGVINVDAGNQNYSSIDGILYNKLQTTIIQCPISKIGVFYFPFQVTSIGEYAFYNSSFTVISYTSSSLASIGDYAFAYSYGLKAFSFPPSVTSIGNYALYECIDLDRISCGNDNPVDLNASEYVFVGVNKNLCELNIPGGSYELYSVANQWKEFLNIVERKVLNLSASSAILTSDGGSVVVNVKTGAAWTAVSDKSWLTINPVSGYRNSTLNINAGPNTSVAERTAVVTVSAPGTVSKTITINQSGSLNPISVTAGALASVLNAGELLTTKKLTLTGTIDARDFKTMRDDMPALTELNLSGVIIAAYTGTLGTYGTDNVSYPANSTPQYAFYNMNTNQGKTSLISITLPNTLTVIGRNSFCSGGLKTINIPASVQSIGMFSFSGCAGLTSINIPPHLTTIEIGVLWGCTGLTSVSIPSSVTTIQDDAFSRCGGLFIVDEGNPNYSSIDGILFNKSKTSLIHFPIARTGTYTIPSSVSIIASSAFDYCIGLTNISIPVSVTTIGSGAFRYCSGLTTFTVPASVNSIAGFAFFGCNGLQSIYTKSIVPVNLSYSTSVFNNVNKSTCILYVPQGSKTIYASANQWKDFANIIEEGTTTGITEAEPYQILIYPNPAKEYVIVNIGDFSDMPDCSIRIISQIGKIVFETNVTQSLYEIDVSSWSSGIYILQVYDNQKVIKTVKKIIID